MVDELVVPGESSICKINISGFSINNFKTLDPTGYRILCNLSETCDALNYFPTTSKVVLDSNQQSQLLYNFQNQFIPNISKELGISQEAGIKTSVDFFSDKQLVVQPGGLQGKVYNTMRTVQNYVPMIYTSEAVSVMKTTGITGIKIIGQASLTFVSATYIGALFFGYCDNIAGNNPVGSIFNFTSFVLSRPMRGVEITLNGLLLRPI